MKEGYKKTDYGKIPVEWDLIKLNNIFKRITTKNKECNKNVLTISAQKGLINQEEFFNKTVASKDNSNYYLLEKDDFAYNKSYSSGYPMGAIKKLEYYDKGIVSPLYICFRLMDEDSDKEFYKYFFEHNIFDKAISFIAQEGARNHGLLNVSVSEFFDLPVFKPPLKEQQKIAEILSTVDSEIDDTDKLIEKTKELKKGLMQRLLTKGIGHKKFKKTEIGEIPVEWDVKILNNISDVRDGTHDSPKYVEQGIPFITSKNLKEYGIDFSDTNYISNEDHEKFSQRSNVDNGDILFGMIGTIGNPVIVRKEFEFSIKNVALIKFNDNSISNTFLLNILKSNLIEKQFEKLSNGGVQKFIALGMIRNLLIPIPSLEEQQQIANILSSVDTQIEIYENKKSKLEELKKGLMQQLLTGKIRVV